MGYPPPNNQGYQGNPNPGYPPPNNQGYQSNPGYPPAGGQSFNPQQQYGGGTKRALLIGINYVGQPGQLRGCVNDVAMMCTFLKSHGFEERNMKVLVDDQMWKTPMPTRANMVDGMRWLSHGARPGDMLFFHYSGHGSQVRDLDGDEKDGYDETIVPLDHRSAGQITDDEVFANLCQPMPQGCRRTAVMDCCHSGTAMDLPYTFKANSANMALVFQNGKFNPSALPAMMMNQKWDKKKYKQQALKLGLELAGQFFSSGKPSGGSGGPAGYQQEGHKQVRAEVIMFSGCADSQTSADVQNVANFNVAPGAGGAGGACTSAMVSVLNKNPHIPIIQLLEEMRKILLAKHFKQVPQLSTSRPIDMGQPFSFGLLHH
uniref:Peptidase C14 caspase domain-containing protein n=1 Tax=Eutreptiella gymnastica TaxID=73025 RepID=A0A7S1J745_9EUGL